MFVCTCFKIEFFLFSVIYGHLLVGSFLTFIPPPFLLGDPEPGIEKSLGFATLRKKNPHVFFSLAHQLDQRVLNDLQWTRLYHDLTEKEREVADGKREGMVEEPNHAMKRKPGPLYIIQCSLSLTMLTKLV